MTSRSTRCVRGSLGRQRQSDADRRADGRHPLPVMAGSAMIVESGWKGPNAAAPDDDRDNTVPRPLCLVRRHFDGR